MIYDVVVVGAGPAGSVCAYLLVRAGLKCLILEKKPEIGEKICGGFLPNRARELLLHMGIDISKTLKKDAVKVKSCMTVKGEKEHCFTYAEEEFGIGAYRKTLDQTLLDEALAQGAEIRFKTEVKQIIPTSEGVMVEGYSAKKVIFASGACGHGKLNVFQRIPKETQMLNQTIGISEIIKGTANLVEDRVYFWYENEKTADYFWAIPVSNGIWNTGFWCQKPDVSMKQRFYELKKKYIGENFTEYETVREPIGAVCGNVNFIPYMQIACYGAGDFCGTNRYESGEGLYHALKSAKETAEEVIKTATVKMGQWPQGENGEILPIEWEVVSLEADKMLLLSKYGLKVRPYKESFSKVYWESSEIRKWLCNEFVFAFDEEEKRKICEVEIENIRGLTKDEPDHFKTIETIFLLSEDEIRKFGKEKAAWIRKPTPYTKKNGAYTDKKGNGVWWLRSYGRLEKLSMCVIRADGGLYPGADISTDNVMICPAMYVRR